jgi:MSHA biogenesis protein MshQ
VLGGTATLSCWIKTTQTGANNSFDAPGVTGVEQGGGSNDIFWGFLDASGAIGLRPGSGRTVKSAGPVNDNMWHNIVMSRDKASGRIEIFVDGKLAKADDGMQTDQKGTAFAALGRITDSSKPYFKGQLDDVRIWDRVLSPTEVAAIFAGN